MSYRLGLVCYATRTGLGVQTKSLYDHLKPAKTMLVDISRINGLPVCHEWYNADITTNGFPTNQEVDAFLKELDVIWVCENPLNYYLFSRARQLGVKIIQQPNYEFLEYGSSPSLPRPDALALPSLWNVETIEALDVAPWSYMPVPVDTVQPRDITQARIFIHIAGRPAFLDRNGTLTFIQAVRMLPAMPGARFVVYCQSPTREILRALRQVRRVELVRELPENGDLYREGDMHVLPRKYGGLCLPLNESLAHGIPVLMPDIDPNNRWLPSNWLTPVTHREQQFRAKSDVQVYEPDVRTLAQKMLDLYRSPETVQTMASEAVELAKEISWANMQIKYEAYIEEALNG